jgi:hypothetical protein
MMMMMILLTLFAFPYHAVGSLCISFLFYAVSLSHFKNKRNFIQTVLMISLSSLLERFTRVY